MDLGVNGISAGPIKTLSAKGIKDFGTILDIVDQRAPLHRNVTTKEVGDATCFSTKQFVKCYYWRNYTCR